MGAALLYEGGIILSVIFLANSSALLLLFLPVFQNCKRDCPRA